jgi:hypothetical protein
MKVTLESTQTLLELEVGAAARVPARLWEGHTEDGTPVIAFITRISPQTHDPASLEQFNRELVERARPSLVMPNNGPWPLRFFIY